jgi:hypothetical protein
MEEAGGRTFEQWSTSLGNTQEAAWQQFSTAVVAAVQGAAVPVTPPQRSPQLSSQPQNASLRVVAPEPPQGQRHSPPDHISEQA